MPDPTILYVLFIDLNSAELSSQQKAEIKSSASDVCEDMQDFYLLEEGTYGSSWSTCNIE